MRLPLDQNFPEPILGNTLELWVKSGRQPTLATRM